MKRYTDYEKMDPDKMIISHFLVQYVRKLFAILNIHPSKYFSVFSLLF